MSRTQHNPKIDDLAAWTRDYQDEADIPSREEYASPGHKCPGTSFHTLPPGPENYPDSIFPSEVDTLHISPATVKKNLWSIVWSDLMMTMFVYFVLMYVFTAAKAQSSSVADSQATNSSLKQLSRMPVKGRKPPQQIPAAITEVYALSKKTVETKGLDQLASVELVPERAVRIILTGDLLFDLAKAELKKEAREKLKGLAPLILRSPYMVNVVGHTDDLPIHSERFSSNWELSVIRACAVARFFIDEMKIPENKFYLSGHSSLQPAKPNISPGNRAANRRVELIITKDRPAAVADREQHISGETS